MLPTQVKSQIAEANAHFVPPQSVETPPAPPAEPSVTPAPAAPPVAAAPVETVSKAEYARVEQQLRSLQGIHKSIETDRAALRAQVATLSQTVNTLSSQVEQYKAVATAPKLVTDAEVTEYTPELMDVISRKAQEIVAPQLQNLTTTIERLTQRNAQLEQAMAGVATKAEKVETKDFFGDITNLMPEWLVVNDDPRFMDWLQQVNPLTGRPYSTDFYAARDDKDAQRIVTFFRTYADLQHVVPAGDPRQTTPAAPAAATPPPLSEMVTPNPGSNPTPQTPANGKMWTQKAIADFYKDKAAGRYAMNPALATSLEADLFKAQGEGRVAA